MYDFRDIFIRIYIYVFPRTTLVGAHPSHTCYMYAECTCQKNEACTHKRSHKPNDRHNSLRGF